MANNQMPHNLEAEAALLGCIILDEAVQAELLDSLRDEDFYEESHRVVLQAMKGVYGARKTIDVVTLTDRLERDGTLEKAGGLKRISELAELTPSAANYKQYLEIVKRDSVRRALIRAAKDIIETSLEGESDSDAIAHAEKLVYEISRKEERRGLKGLADGELINNVLDKLTAIHQDENAFRGLRTGINGLDKLTNGLQKSDLIIVAARPGQGKTSIAMNFVRRACVDQHKVAAVFSLEMPAEQLLLRLQCAIARVDMAQALSGQLKDGDWRAIMNAGDRLQKSKLFIDDSSRITTAEILSKCRRLAAAEGSIDLIMIDYIQLMGGELRDGKKNGGGNLYENRQQEVAAITRDLKIIAKELNVPVIALSQLRRITTDDPQLSDLRESGAIEQDADIVMFLNRLDLAQTPKKTKSGQPVPKGATDLIIAKHRNGGLGRIPLHFDGGTTTFLNATPEYGIDYELEPEFRGRMVEAAALREKAARQAAQQEEEDESEEPEENEDAGEDEE